MRFRYVAFATGTLAATSSAFNFGGENDVINTQTAGTVAPDQGTDSLTPASGVNGFGNFGMTTQLTPASGTGNQGWPQQQGWSSGPDTDWTPPNQGNQWGPQLEWPSNPTGGGGEPTSGLDCSGSSDGILTPPSGDQGWGTLGVDCSDSNEGGLTHPSGGWDQGLGLECSGSSEGAGTPPSGDQGWGVPSSDCSESTGFSMAGSSAVESSQEAAPASSVNAEPSMAGSTTTEFSTTSSTNTEISAAGSATTESSVATSTASSGPGAQDSLSPSISTGGSSSAAPSSESLPSSETGDQGWSQTTQTSLPTDSSDSATSTGSNVGADADQSSNLRSSHTAKSSSSSETTQQQQQQQQQDDSSIAYTDTSGSDVIAYTSVWGSPVVSETSSNHTSDIPTFGDVTSKTGECVTGNPNEYISNEYLDWVWEHRIGPKADLSNESNWNVMANKNWIMDKLVHNNGSINYCVRWDTDNQLSKDVASEFQGVLTRHYNAWNKWLEGYNCWPFTEIDVNMVGWATKEASQFVWKDESLGTIYEGVLDPADGVPMCPNECYRFYDNVNNVWSDTSACKGEPFDISFWLKESIPYGFGYDWGQEVSLNNTLQNLYDKNILFVGHEIGHGFGLPDFYDLTQKPSKDFPQSIMMAYSSITITPSDGWMLRRVLDNVKPRYKF